MTWVYVHHAAPLPLARPTAARRAQPSLFRPFCLYTFLPQAVSDRAACACVWTLPARSHAAKRGVDNLRGVTQPHGRCRAPLHQPKRPRRQETLELGVARCGENKKIRLSSRIDLHVGSEIICSCSGTTNYGFIIYTELLVHVTEAVTSQRTCAQGLFIRIISYL